MDKLVILFLAYSNYIPIYILIVVAVVIGISTQNTFNNPKAEDLRGKKLFMASLFLSLLIFFAMGSWATWWFIGLVSLVFGFGSEKLIKKLDKDKIWENFLWIIDKFNKGKGE